MCKNSMVEQVVQTWVDKGFMFTAWDVTKFIRATIDPNIRHSAVNDDVKSLFRNGEMGDYEHDTKDVGAQVPPFVYYHRNCDVNNYQSDWVENNTTQKGMLNDSTGSTTGVAQPTPSTLGSNAIINNAFASTVPVATVKAPKGAVCVNSEGRLNISPSITMLCGFNIRQTVWIEKLNNKLVITPSVCSGSHPVTVNNDGRIRVCKTLLSQISPTATYFKILIQSRGTVGAGKPVIAIEAA